MNSYRVIIRLGGFFRITVKCYGRSIFMGPGIIAYEDHAYVLSSRI